MAQTFNCPACGAPLDYDGGPDLTLRCPFCANTVIVPAALRTGAAAGSEAEAEPAPGPRLLKQVPEWAEIDRLVRDGKKIDAIRIFRRLTGASLSESKTAIEKISEGRALEVGNYGVVMQQKGISAEAHDHASQIHRVGQLLKLGKKQAAIETYRTLFKVDVAEATHAIEQLATTVDTPGAFDLHPPTVGPRVVPRTEAGSATPRWLLPGIVLGVLGLVAGLFFLSTLDQQGSLETISGAAAAATQAQASTPELTATEAPTREPAPTTTPEFASVNILAACIGDSPTCFEQGRFVGVDGAENIYAGEANGRIQAFDSLGDYQAEWRIAGDEDLHSLAVDRAGVVYAVHGGLIYRYGGLPGGASGVALGPLEYEGGQGFQSVAATREGGLVAAWNKDWRGGLFTNFSESQDDIVIFDSAGRVVRVIAQALSVVAGGNPELSTLIAADAQGNIYASGLLNEGIYKFSADGRFMNKFGQAELEGITALGIAVDAQGRVYVSGGHGGVTQVFGPDGRFLAQIGYGGTGLAVTDDGRVLAMDDNQLFEFTLNPQP